MLLKRLKENPEFSHRDAADRIFALAAVPASAAETRTAIDDLVSAQWQVETDVLALKDTYTERLVALIILLEKELDSFSEDFHKRNPKNPATGKPYGKDFIEVKAMQVRKFSELRHKKDNVARLVDLLTELLTTVRRSRLNSLEQLNNNFRQERRMGE